MLDTYACWFEYLALIVRCNNQFWWIDLDFAFCVSVVWKTKVRNCWTDVFYSESTSSSAWSLVLNDIEILDKVFCLPPLLVLLRWLFVMIANFLDIWNSIHKEFCLRQGVSSPISDLTERLLLEDKDAPATPQESLLEVPPFDEVKWSSFLTIVFLCCVLNQVMACFLMLLGEDICVKPFRLLMFGSPF